MYDYYITPEEYDIAASNGISRNALDLRVRERMWDKQRAITEPPKKTKTYLNKSLTEAKRNGISSHNFYRRVRSVYTHKKASTMPVMNSEQIVKRYLRNNKSPRNRKYPDWVYEKKKKNNIKDTTFWHRINTHGWSVEEACSTPVGGNNENKICN